MAEFQEMHLAENYYAFINRYMGSDVSLIWGNVLFSDLVVHDFIVHLEKSNKHTV